MRASPQPLGRQPGHLARSSASSSSNILWVCKASRTDWPLPRPTHVSDELLAERMRGGWVCPHWVSHAERSPYLSSSPRCSARNSPRSQLTTATLWLQEPQRPRPHVRFQPLLCAPLSPGHHSATPRVLHCFRRWHNIPVLVCSPQLSPSQQ